MSTQNITGQSVIEVHTRERMSAQDWAALSMDLNNGIEAALASRATLNDNLKDWEELYEMLVDGDAKFPWPGAANIFVPLIPTQLESSVAYVLGQVLVPHLFMVTGNNPDAQKHASKTERYLNSELRRPRDGKTWFEEVINFVHTSYRDGTGIMESLWNYSKTSTRAQHTSEKTIIDPITQTQVPVIDKKTGLPEKVIQEVDIEKIHDDVQWKSIDLRNFYTIPGNARSVEDALGCAVIEYLYEDQLNALVKDGVLSAKEVEYALNFVPTGSSELPSSEVPTTNYTAGEQIELGPAQGTQTSRFFKNRGPIEVHRVHTRQYALDADKIPREHIFWFHKASQRMLGFKRYPYLINRRPFTTYCPYPRPNQLTGYSLVERLAGLQNETNAQRNQQLNYGDLKLSPPIVRQKGAFNSTSNMSWGLNRVWEADGVPPAQAVQVVQLPDIDQATASNEQMIRRDAQEYTGLSNPLIGQPSGGRRSATEARQWAASNQTRTGLIAMRLRLALRELINFTFALKRQFVTTNQTFSINGEVMTLTPEELDQDYLIEVSGAADPIDVQARRQEVMSFGQFLLQIPLVSQSPEHLYNLIKKMADTFDWSDVENIIGTADDAVKLSQQMQQKQEQEQQQQQHNAGASMALKENHAQGQRGNPGNAHRGGMAAGPPQMPQ